MNEINDIEKHKKLLKEVIKERDKVSFLSGQEIFFIEDLYKCLSWERQEVLYKYNTIPFYRIVYDMSYLDKKGHPELALISKFMYCPVNDKEYYLGEMIKTDIEYKLYLKYKDLLSKLR